MTVTRQITEHAGSLFDVVGVSQLSSGDNLLIMGLESTAERDLDEFGRVEGVFQMYGFEKHVSSRLESVLNFIRGQGFSAEPVGQYGYPLEGEVNLKKEAIRAGLGKRGKSTIVLHPKYGPRLRFAAIRSDAPLEPPIYPVLTEDETQLCNGCSICIDDCPVKALEPYYMPDTSICLSNTTNMTQSQERIVPCDICLSLCPVARTHHNL
jgi:epoxyqueuosine reductase QueG